MANTYELLYMSRMGDEYAFKALFYEYKSSQKALVDTILLKFNKFSIYREDLYQEANIILAEATDRFREDKGATFATFLNILTNRKILAVIRHYTTPSYCHIHNMFPIIDQVKENEGAYVVSLENDLSNPTYALDFYDAAERLGKMLEGMNEKERRVYEAWLDGLSYRDAAEKLNMTSKMYENRLCRIRRKIRNSVFDK